LARPIAKDHDDKRLHILKSAARVFAQEGVARASMVQVAADCQISKANIYHYYHSKDALIFDILDSYLSALRDRLQNLPLADMLPSDRLTLLCTEILLAYQGMDHEHKIQTEGLGLLPLEQQAVLKAYQHDMVAQMSDVLREIAPNVFASDAQMLKATTMSVFGMLNWFYMWKPKADRAERVAYGAHVAKMTLGGVRDL
jgi:AcrR family transcriptional regulator